MKYTDKKARETANYLVHFCLYHRCTHGDDCQDCPFLEIGTTNCMIEEPRNWFTPGLLKEEK